jgi:hypothetical protein
MSDESCELSGFIFLFLGVDGMYSAGWKDAFEDVPNFRGERRNSVLAPGSEFEEKVNLHMEARRSALALAPFALSSDSESSKGVTQPSSAWSSSVFSDICNRDEGSKQLRFSSARSDSSRKVAVPC